jgi:hypothetical protein
LRLENNYGASAWKDTHESRSWRKAERWLLANHVEPQDSLRRTVTRTVPSKCHEEVSNPPRPGQGEQNYGVTGLVKAINPVKAS